MSIIIEAEKIRKTYVTRSEELEVLKGLDLSVEEGTTVSITGDSGSGKSTLLNILGGLDYPTSGRVVVAKEEISSMGEDQLPMYRNIFFGFIFQFHYLLKEFNVLENVFMPLLVRGKGIAEGKRRASELLEAVGLKDKARAFPQELSGGEKQRVAVARALVGNPRIILADEPTGNLDENNTGIVEDLLFSLVKHYGKTLIIVTHDRVLASKTERNLELEHGVLWER